MGSVPPARRSEPGTPPSGPAPRALLLGVLLSAALWGMLGLGLWLLERALA
jgi:hypothetical protein